MNDENNSPREQFMLDYPTLDTLADDLTMGLPINREARLIRHDSIVVWAAARAVRKMHSPRLFTDVAAHVTIPICAECRQDHPCATIQTLDDALAGDS